jgi:hypothetical protein
MALVTHNTSTWPYEKVAAYGSTITAHLKKYADAFPTDATVESLFRDITEGRRVLWLVMDGDDVVCIALSEVVLSDIGVPYGRIVAISGDRGVEAVPLIEQVEEWARSKGAVKMQQFTRLGMSKHLRKQGYTGNLMLVEKDL